MFLVKGVVEDFSGASGSGAGGRTGSVHAGELGFRTGAIMSPFGSEGTY